MLADRPDIEPALFDARLVSTMRRAFPAASVEWYERLIDAMDNHPKDRHVAAAAVHVGAAAVVTYNVRDFDSEVLRQRGIAVVTPPQLIGQLVADEPSVVALAVRAMSARKKRPRMSSRRSPASKASEHSKIRYKCWSIDAFNATTRMALRTIFELGMSRNRSG